MSEQADPAGSAPPVRRWWPRRSRVVLLLALLAGALLLAEIGLRQVIFSQTPSVRSLAWRVRSEGNFTDELVDDDFWKLRWLFRPAGQEQAYYPHHEVLGWTSGAFDPETFEHRDEGKLRGRRPVLLFGDSFAHCVTEFGTCWQDLLERSPLSDRFRLLNYGVRGYGFDQSVLLMSSVLARFAGQEPVVILSVMVDDDLDRSALTLRDWPKPHFSLTEDGGLKLDGPVPEGMDEVVSRNPPAIRSYLWRYLIWGSSWVPDTLAEPFRGRSARVAATQELNRRLIDRATGELEASGVDGFFLLFHAARFAPEKEHAWQERFMIEELAARGAPMKLTRPLLSAAAWAADRTLESYYIPLGNDADHLNVGGNQVTFEAIERGLQGVFDDPAELRLACADSVTLKGPLNRLLFYRAGVGETPRPPENQLVFRLKTAGRVGSSYRLEGRAKRFTGRLRVLPIPGRDERQAQASFAVGADGRQVLVRPIVEGEEAAIDVDLTGVEMLHLAATNEEQGVPVVVSLQSPRVD